MSRTTEHIKTHFSTYDVILKKNVLLMLFLSRTESVRAEFDTIQYHVENAKHYQSSSTHFVI